MEDGDEYDIEEQIFHNTVREHIIFLLLFLFLYLLSWLIIGYFKKSDQEDCFYSDDDERIVYKISVYLCTFSLSVAICATCLLPLSIISNEVLLLYPNSYYVKWLNHSLIQGIWNLVFLFSNLSLFGLLPFAYLFTESEGFKGFQNGVKSRFFETIMVLTLVGLVVFGISFVVSALIDSSRLTLHTLQSFRGYCLPFLYSCISFLGVMMLLVCTPVGLTQMFGMISATVAKPQFIYDVNDDLTTASLEELTIKRRLSQAMRTRETYILPKPMIPPRKFPSDKVLTLLNGALLTGLEDKLRQINLRKQNLLKREATSAFKRSFIYPMATVLLVSLSALSVLLVLFNSLQLAIGIKSLPANKEFQVGVYRLSFLGWVGSLLEVVQVIFLTMTSYLGLYSLPWISKHIRPKHKSVTLTLLIMNSALLIVLSSAIPLLARIVGITNFDLLGDFGKIEWLGNLNIILLYNIAFAGVTTLCLINKLTAAVCRELIVRLKKIISFFKRSKRCLIARRGVFSSVAHFKED